MGKIEAKWNKLKKELDEEKNASMDYRGMILFMQTFGAIQKFIEEYTAILDKTEPNWQKRVLEDPTLAPVLEFPVRLIRFNNHVRDLATFLDAVKNLEKFEEMLISREEAVKKREKKAPSFTAERKRIK